MFRQFRKSTLFSCLVKKLPHNNWIMPKRSLGASAVKKKFKSYHKQIDQSTITSKNKSTPSANSSNPIGEASMTILSTKNDNEIGINEETCDIEVQYLDPPIKSANDKKEYRVIKLPNGLTALLIADLYSANGLSDDRVLGEKEDVENSSHIDASSSSDDSSNETESEASDEETDGEDMEKCSDDESSPKTSKRDEKMAACGLCVGVGSFSDPPEIQGLAHFLEHMVFMGSNKYPLENDFDAFIQKRGGSDNASTECEQTTFYFEIDEKYLLSALDRFAQFFINPLMLRDAITREREAVESEFQMALPSDFYRKEQLFCSFAQPKHPATKFPWGNLVTLRDTVSDDKLYEELHKFRERHYSANRMTITIQARLSLDTLENYVKQCFANVPCNNLPPEDFSNFKGVRSFDTPEFRRIYKIKPVKNVCQIELTWAMPSLLHLYRAKPHQYISWIIGHEGKGSLISYLRKKMWCLNIFSGNGESGFEYSSMYALFSLSLVLTDEGHKHLKEVLDAIFSYINMMKSLGPQKRIFDEIKMIEETTFRFANEVPPADNVEVLCENMHFYESKDYITGGDLYFDYDPEAITACMEALRPDNVNIIIFDKKFDDEDFVKVEPWFQTKYADSEIPNDWIESWKTLEPYKEFHLPEPNIYLTDDFTLIPIDSDIPYPIKIHQNALSEIWYKPDSKFRLPDCQMHFYFISPIVMSSPEASSMTDLMVAILKQLLVEDLYPATAAELNYGIQVKEKGLLINVHGFNQKLHLLLETIIKSISKFSNLVTEDLFQVMKEEQLKDYYNTFLKPSKLNKDVRLSILLLNHWTSVDKHAAMSLITFDQFRNFTKHFIDHIYIQCLVQGNMRKEEVIENVLKCFDILGCGTLLPNTFPQIRVLALPQKKMHCCRIKNFNSTDANSVVTNYYQSDLSSIKLSVMIELLIMIMEEPLFNQLRTKEQLGYNVFSLLRNTYGIYGYSVTVCTQADKFSIEHIDNRIEEFLKSFKATLRKSTEKDLDEVKEALVKIKQCADIHLKEEVERNWGEITANQYVFDRLNKEIEMISKIDIETLRKWFEMHVIDGDNFRKLSVQIVGTDKNEKNEIQNDDLVNLKKRNLIKFGENNEHRLKYLTNLSNENLKKSMDYYITDIEDFKRDLYVFPIPREDV